MLERFRKIIHHSHKRTTQAQLMREQQLIEEELLREEELLEEYKRQQKKKLDRQAEIRTEHNWQEYERKEIESAKANIVNIKKIEDAIREVKENIHYWETEKNKLQPVPQVDFPQHNKNIETYEGINNAFHNVITTLNKQTDDLFINQSSKIIIKATQEIPSYTLVDSIHKFADKANEQRVNLSRTTTEKSSLLYNYIYTPTLQILFLYLDLLESLSGLIKTSTQRIKTNTDVDIVKRLNTEIDNVLNKLNISRFNSRMKSYSNILTNYETISNYKDATFKSPSTCNSNENIQPETTIRERMSEAVKERRFIKTCT